MSKLVVNLLRSAAIVFARSYLFAAYRHSASYLAVVGVLACGGCGGTFIPGSGPDRSTVLEGATYAVIEAEATKSTPYAIVPLSPRVIESLRMEAAPPGFTGALLRTRPTEPAIGIGDVLTVTIFESQPGGLFVPQETSSRTGNFVALPPQQVDRSGNISVPFAGTIRAAGQTAAQVQHITEGRLAGRAIEPQAIVTITERQSNFISVLGDVATSQRFTLDPKGDRILSAIARAGGPRHPAYESMVTIQRGGKIQRALLSRIALDPQQNIALQPDDVILLNREPRYFTSLGAMGQTTAVSQIDRRFPFDDERLSLIDAIGRAGGLTDDRANPRAVFLFRFESLVTLREAGIQITGPLGQIVPTVYVANMVNPSTFFLARQFEMHDGDLIYVSNAPATELSKFLSVVLPGASSTSAIRATVP